MKILTQYDKLDSVYYSLIDILRYVAFIGLVSISMILSVTFYISAVEETWSKAMLGFAAFGLESVKIYTLIFAEYAYHSTKMKRRGKKFSSQDWFRISKPFTLFAFLTLLSVIASISFAQASIYSTIEEVQVVMQKEAEVQEKGNPLIEAKTILLENKQAQLTALNEKIANLPPDYVTSSLKLSAEVNILNEDIYNLSEEIAIIQLNSYEEKVDVSDEMIRKKATFNRFYLLGKPIGLTETQTLFLFLALFAVLLELGIIATAPAPEKRSIRELIGTRIEKKDPVSATIRKKKPARKKPTVKKKPIKKEPPLPLNETVAQNPEGAGLRSEKLMAVRNKNNEVDVLAAAEVGVVFNPPSVEAIEVIRERANPSQLLSELHNKGSVYLKTAAQAAYTSGRSADEYIHLIERLSKMKPNKTSRSLVSKEGNEYKMNYAFSNINSALNKKEVK